MASESKTGSSTSNIWPWALAVGLLTGFLIGREMGPRTGGSASDADEAAEPAAAVAADEGGAAAPAKIYGSEDEFPAGWRKSADLVGMAGLSFDGLTAAQKATAMQALNERNCECGCGRGSIATCVKTDPNCPRSPVIAKKALEMAKGGSGLAAILTAIDKENPGAGAPAAAAGEPAPSTRKVTIPAHSPRKGPKNAKVTIVAFSDFQCPFCARVVPTLEQIEKEYKDVALVFVNQPLGFHDRARPAAKAMLAAHRQGKAWPMHDKMFANQQALSDADLERYAKELALNVPKWKKDMADPAVEKMVADDQTLANSVGASGTPTFFINGRELSGAQPFPAFKAIIDEEIKKADALLAKGTKPAELYEKLMAEAAAAAPSAPAAGGAPPTPAKVDIDVGGAPAIGPKSAKVTVVAFSDFQCPFCSRAVPIMKQIEEQYKNKVRLAFKHLPLGFHQHAQIAAEASMAAHEQGKFWPYHDKLFENQQSLDRASLERYAQEMGLNMAKFKAALDSGKFKKYVEQDAALAAKVGASGTPTFYVNGKQLVGAQPFDQFKQLIDAELN